MASAPAIPELSVRAPVVDAAVVKPTPLEAAGFTAQHIGIAVFLGLGAAALIVGLSLGFALPRPTNTVTNTLSVAVNVTVLPDWAVFPAEEGASWDYDTHSAIGPEKWGKITKNSSTKELYYPICAQTSQSPINIVTSTATVASTSSTYNPKRFYNATSFKIAARPGGHPGFAVSPVNGTAVWMVDGVSYSLLQFHYHSPSEHTVDGVRFPLEVHFVHQSASGALAVFGILYPYSEDGIVSNPFITQWWDQIFTEKNRDITYPIDFSQMIDSVTTSVPLFRYSGSLTTPPCSEGVSWHVSVAKEGVSKAEVYAYKMALETVSNFRPVQPLNGRTVTKQTPVLPSTWA